MLELRLGKALVSFCWLSHIACGRECLLVYIFPPSFLIELVLEMLLWLDVMVGLGLLSHTRTRRPPGLGLGAMGLGLWALGNKLNLTKVLDPGPRVCGGFVSVGDL